MTIGSTRVTDLLSEFDAACAQLRAAIVDTPDASWHTVAPDDGRQVNVIAHHAASSHQPIAEMVLAMVNGHGPSISMDQIHAGNADHAQRAAQCSRDEALAVHDQGAQHAMGVLQTLTDDQLQIKGQFLVGGRESTVEQSIEFVLIGHPRMHAASIAAAMTV
jgi:hypothetical protein